MSNDEPKYTAFNYCVCFIDLLGQRNAAQGQGLLPNISSEAERRGFSGSLIEEHWRHPPASTGCRGVKEGLVSESQLTISRSFTWRGKSTWDEIQFKSVKTQYWSDGFVKFVCLGVQENKYPAKGVLSSFARQDIFVCWVWSDDVLSVVLLILLEVRKFVQASYTVQQLLEHTNSKVK